MKLQKKKRRSWFHLKKKSENVAAQIEVETKMSRKEKIENKVKEKQEKEDQKKNDREEKKKEKVEKKELKKKQKMEKTNEKVEKKKVIWSWMHKKESVTVTVR